MTSDKGMLIPIIWATKLGFKPLQMATMPIVFIEPKAEPKMLTCTATPCCLKMPTKIKKIIKGARINLKIKPKTKGRSCWSKPLKLICKPRRC